MSFWNVIDIRHLERPHNWSRLFERTAPLVLEIGFGRAGHLIHLGKTMPDWNVIGIETSRPSLKKASSKVKNNAVTNVRVIDGSGYALLWLHIAEASLDELHINFPDPWPKERSMHRQLIDHDFMTLAATRLKPGAKLFIATDHPDYQPIVTDCLEQTPYFRSRLDTTYTLVDNDRFRTKYELKALAEGRVPFYYHWERNDTPAPNTYPLPQELPMPHAIVTLPLTVDEIAAKFEPFEPETPVDGIHVRFPALYRTTHNDALLMEAYINEPPSAQRIGISIQKRQKDGDGYVVQMHTIGFPRPTEGAHIAIGRLASWLATLHDDAAILRHNLQHPPAVGKPPS